MRIAGQMRDTGTLLLSRYLGMTGRTGTIPPVANASQLGNAIYRVREIPGRRDVHSRTTLSYLHNVSGRWDTLSYRECHTSRYRAMSGLSDRMNAKGN